MGYEVNKVFNEDCIEGMKDIPDKSVDMILTDLPYEMVKADWDWMIPFEELWEQYERVIVDNGAIVLTASGSFSYKLISSNLDLYRYKWIWVKNTASNFLNAKNKPMSSHEDILVFSKGTTANGTKNKMKYYPQGLRKINKRGTNNGQVGVHGIREKKEENYVQEYENYPKDVLRFPGVKRGINPTQKPLKLLEYLIRTYTNKNELVLDSCMGSFATAVAAYNTERNFIGYEKDKEMYEEGYKRYYKDIKRPKGLWNKK